MSVQQFCLRWNNHQPNFISVCSSLLHNGTLVDVTLAAEGRQLQAHKIVLSACSSYFQTLFTTNPCQHPIVILKDVQYDDLKTMVDFMYYGEVNVSQEQLPHILKTAEMLKIKGLAEMPTDAATLTKSESKSSSDQPDQLQSSGSGTDSLWGSSESQFQQQQPQQHHHHHHHQQSQTQQLHQLRRTPSPLGAGTSPATRRKRLRKSSNNGSGDRNSDEHVDTGANINLSQMSQMSFSGNTAGLGHTLHTKIIKESTSVDVEAHQQDSSPDSLDDGHGHPHTMQIKPETDMSVPQTLPLDISGGTTPSEHDGPNAACSQSQSSHSGLQWTVVDSNYSRFSLSSCQANLIGNGNTNNPNNPNGNGGLSNQSANNPSNNGNQNPGDHQQQQQHHRQQQQQQQQQQNANNSNGNSSAAGGGNGLGNPQQQQGHIQMHYQNSTYSPQIISVNSLVGSYSQNLSTPTSPNESAMVQSVYSQGPTPTQSPVHQMNTVPSALAPAGGPGGSGPGSGASSTGGPNNPGNGASLGGGGSASSVVNAAGNSGAIVGNTNQVQSGSQTTQTTAVKRKRSVNPQGDENFIRALEAVRSGGIGFCKAARLYGVNNRTLWLEYKKRGYPISRPSIKSRVVKQENLSPSPTPTNEETTIENYEHINQSAINMQVPPTSDTPTPLMCTPHPHPMGVMSFLDTRHMEFSTSIHPMSRQRYVDGAVNVNPAAMNLQSINFNSI